MTPRRISAASLRAHQGHSRSAAQERPSRRAVWARPLALLCVLAAASVAAALLGMPDTRALRGQIAEAGPLAPAVFVLLYALVTLLPLPKNVFAAVAGVLFGLVLGIVVVLLAALLGAGAAFGLSRALGREAVERLTGGKVARVDALLSRRGTLAVIAVRLVPVLPFTAINYAAGLTSVRIRDYALGTAVGIVPGTVSFVALGTYGTTPGSWPFLVSITALALLSGGGLLVARRRRRHRKRAAAVSNAPTSAAAEGVQPCVMVSRGSGRDRVTYADGMRSPIPDYLLEVLDSCGTDGGAVADYIPELAAADPDRFGICVATVDGTIYAAGDADAEFTIQSMSKPFTYALALADRGVAALHGRVGVEPSDEAFNDLSLEPQSGRPRNAMINAGALLTH